MVHLHHPARREGRGLTRRLRILVAHNVLNNRRGGMSRLMGFIHDRVEQDGHTVDYFGAEQIPVRLAGRLARFGFPWLLWRHAVKAAKAGRPYDIINVHEPSAAVVSIARRSAGNPILVVTTHGVEDRGWAVSREDARLGRTHLSFRTRLWHPLTLLPQARLGLRWADHVICLNEEDRAFLERVYGLPADRITRVFPAADPAYTAVYVQRDYATADRLVFFGTWLARKGNREVIDAFALLKERHPELRLLVIGAGFEPDVVLGSFPAALRDQIEVVPSGPATEYAKRMLGAAAYLVPSVFEGTPLTLMEAMGTGLPAIGTSVCGMKDVIRDGENGLLVPARDSTALAAAADRVLTNRALRERLGRQAHADVITNYTWDRVARPVRELYRQLTVRMGGAA